MFVVTGMTWEYSARLKLNQVYNDVTLELAIAFSRVKPVHSTQCCEL